MIVDGPIPFVLFRDQPHTLVEERPAESDPSADYFGKRELAETVAAEAAVSPEARRRHQELARAYARLASQAKPGAEP
jgi:hypothetical protein